MISAKNITRSFGDLQVLKDINLEIQKGEFISIVGTSGAGKTTLLQILGTLLKPTSGTIEINNVRVDQLGEKALSRFRNQNIGFVFQFHQLLPEFNALENVCLPGFIAGKPKKDVIEKAEELLSLLFLTERLTHKPNELSGGEKQRVAVARALINEPAVILADEPTGNLDSENTHELFNLFLDLGRKLNQTFIIVTHNKELAAQTDRILQIKDGKII